MTFVSDQYKTQEKCKRAVEKDPYALEFVPMHLLTQDMCNKVVKKCPWSLIYVPDCYVRPQEMWYKDYSYVVAPEYWLYDDKLIE